MRKIVPALILLCLLLAGCGARPAAEPLRRTVFAMDTVMHLAVYGGSEADLQSAEDEINRLDALLARTKPDSAVYALNQTGTVRDATLAELCARAKRISAETGGAFDVTVAPVLALWGFGENAETQRVPDGGALAEALSHVGHGNLTLSDGGVTVNLTLPAQVDFGGIAKGYAAEKLLHRLDLVTGAVIDLGGDVAVYGAKPDGSAWRVAVKDPADETAYLGVLETAGGVYAATSGVYERYFDENGVRYHHILDPKTGYPAVSGVVSATVVCESGVWADALATACCVAGAEGSLAMRARLADTMAFDLILVTEEGDVYYTCEGFAPETENGYSYERIA